jgi:threonine synthase
VKSENRAISPIVTPLHLSAQLSQRTGGTVYIKDESHQITGTVKGRIIRPVIQYALQHQIDRLVVFWLGNTARALTWGAALHDIALTCITQPHAPTSIKKELSHYTTFIDGFDMEKEFLTEEKMESMAQQGNEKVKAILNLFPDYYATISREIAEKIKPDHIIVPLGSGSLFFGLWMGLQACGLTQTKITGVTLQGKNPFSRACNSFRYQGVHKFLENFTHSSQADKIAQPYAGFEPQVNALLGKGNTILEVTEEELMKAHNYVNNELTISAEPSAAIAFAGLEKMKLNPNDTVVVINTGNGFVKKM